MKVGAANKFLISYYVCTLYTSIPFKRTIDIPVNVTLEHNSGLKITIAELKRLCICSIRYLFIF